MLRKALRMECDEALKKVAEKILLLGHKEMKMAEKNDGRKRRKVEVAKETAEMVVSQLAAGLAERECHRKEVAEREECHRKEFAEMEERHQVEIAEVKQMIVNGEEKRDGKVAAVLTAHLENIHAQLQAAGYTEE